MILDLSPEKYQAMPALSAGGIWTLSEVCPARYWAESPFNPDAIKSKSAAHFDIGTAAHCAVLELELYAERIVHVPFDDYRTKEARDIRDAAYAASKTPLKPAEVEIANSVRDALHARREIADLFRGGHAEASITFEIDGVPCKCRPDYIAKDHILDLKTVASAHPRAVAMAAMRDGWHVRAPWYLHGVAMGAPELLPATGRLRYLFVCVEKTPPYLIEVYELEARAIAWGEHVIRRGLRLFQQCREDDRWPSYNDHFPVALPLPSFAEFQLAEREQSGDFDERPSSAAVRRGNQWLAP